MSLGLRKSFGIATVLACFACEAVGQQYLPPSRPQGQGAQPAQPAGPQYQPAQPGQSVAPPNQSTPQNGQVIPPPGQGGVAVPPVPRAPFEITAEEQATLEMMLRLWEQKSSQISTFECGFTLHEYDANWVAPGANPALPKRISQGELRYAKPDKGSYHITHEVINGQPTRTDRGDWWVCDGKAIFAIDHVKKEVVENRLPPELQGKSIADGPLPFVFGAEADKMLKRYWLRIITPANVQNQVWIEAVPKWRQDTQNYQKVHVILTQQDMMPYAVKLFLPQHQEKPQHPENKTVANVYVFRDIKRNDPVHRFIDFFRHFVAPPTPFGYKRVVVQPEVADNGPPPARPQAPGQPPVQAERAGPMPPLR